MPTMDELEGIYEKGLEDQNMTPLLKTTGWHVWSGETDGSYTARAFYFPLGSREWHYISGYRNASSYRRAFAVRSRKEVELTPDKFQEVEFRLENGKSPTASPVDSGQTQGHDISAGNNIVKDTKTGLEWIAGPDKDTTWKQAKSWVNKLRNTGGGGWRMPTLNELEDIHEKGLEDQNMAPLLKTTGRYVWSSGTEDSSITRYLYFGYGGGWGTRNDVYNFRAFAVRSQNDG